MFETDDEIAALQALLDRSHAGSSAHMQSIADPEHRLSARQVVTYLQGIKHVSFATVTARGEPMVSPLDSLFVHGRFVVSTAGDALRVRHIRRQPAVSLCHLMGDDVGIWVHGRVPRILGESDPEVADYDRVATGVYGSSPFTWGENIVVMAVEPRAMYTFALDPAKFPGKDGAE